MGKITDAQKRAAAKYKKAHSKQQTKYVYKSNCKNFILKYTSKEDLQEVKEYIKQREQRLKEDG